MNPISYLKQLNLSPNEYLVVGSALLAVKGIKPLNDIDLLVHPNLFEKLQTRGWKYDQVIQDGVVKNRITHGICEAFTEFHGKSFDDWTKDPSTIEIVEGVPFLNLGEILEVKRQWHREKDIADIQAIEQYLDDHSS